MFIFKRPEVAVTVSTTTPSPAVTVGVSEPESLKEITVLVSDPSVSDGVEIAVHLFPLIGQFLYPDVVIMKFLVLPATISK